MYVDEQQLLLHARPHGGSLPEHLLPCRNVYGNDVGGTFRGFKDPVTECNWRAFRHEVITNGRTSNGVGPSQLTFKGFFTDMESKGL